MDREVQQYIDELFEKSPLSNTETKAKFLKKLNQFIQLAKQHERVLEAERYVFHKQTAYIMACEIDEEFERIEIMDIFISLGKLRLQGDELNYYRALLQAYRTEKD